MYKKYGNTDDTITFFSKNSHTKEKESICNMLFILHITTVPFVHTYLTGKKSKQKFFFISCPESPGNTFFLRPMQALRLSIFYLIRQMHNIFKGFSHSPAERKDGCPAAHELHTGQRPHSAESSFAAQGRQGFVQAHVTTILPDGFSGVARGFEMMFSGSCAVWVGIGLAHHLLPHCPRWRGPHRCDRKSPDRLFHGLHEVRPDSCSIAVPGRGLPGCVLSQILPGVAARLALEQPSRFMVPPFFIRIYFSKRK